MESDKKREAKKPLGTTAGKLKEMTVHEEIRMLWAMYDYLGPKQQEIALKRIGDLYYQL